MGHHLLDECSLTQAVDADARFRVAMLHRSTPPRQDLGSTVAVDVGDAKDLYAARGDHARELASRRVDQTQGVGIHQNELGRSMAVDIANGNPLRLPCRPDDRLRRPPLRLG